MANPYLLMNTIARPLSVLGPTLFPSQGGRHPEYPGNSPLAPRATHPLIQGLIPSALGGSPGTPVPMRPPGVAPAPSSPNQPSLFYRGAYGAAFPHQKKLDTFFPNPFIKGDRYQGYHVPEIPLGGSGGGLPLQKASSYKSPYDIAMSPAQGSPLMEGNVYKGAGGSAGDLAQYGDLAAKGIGLAKWGMPALGVGLAFAESQRFKNAAKQAADEQAQARYYQSMANAAATRLNPYLSTPVQPQALTQVPISSAQQLAGRTAGLKSGIDLGESLFKVADRARTNRMSRQGKAASKLTEMQQGADFLKTLLGYGG